MARRREDNFENLVLDSIRDAESFCDDELASHNIKTWRYYNGQVDLKSKKGRSKAIKTEVRDTVELLMPSIMKIFCSVNNIVEFVTTDSGGGTPEEAAQLTKDVNDIFYNQNPGWMILHDATKESFVSRLGCFKVYEEDYDDSYDVDMEPGDPLNDILLSVSNGVMNDDGTATFSEQRTKICIETIPAEEIIIDRYAPNSDKPSLIGQRTRVRLGKLIEMGFDKDFVETLADSEDDTITEQQEQARSGYNRYGSQLRSNSDSEEHWALREVVLKEVYIWADREGTGELLLHQCFVSGDKLLRSEVVKWHPYIQFSSIRIPHSAIGRSPGENTVEFQNDGTALQRQILDNLYWSNNPALTVVKGAANPYQIQDWGFGEVFDVRMPNAVQPLVIPFVADKAIGYLDWQDRQREQRTGAFKDALGLNPVVLRGQTATAAEGAATQAHTQLEMYARVIGETGLVPLFRKIVMIKTGREPRYGMKINVGLGSGTTVERFTQLSAVSMKQEQIILQLGKDNPICGLEHYAYTLQQLALLTPHYDANKMFNPPEKIMQMLAQQPPQEPPPDPKMIEAQGRIQIAQQKAQADMQAKQADMQIKQQQAQIDAQLKMMTAQQKFELEKQLAQERIALERQKQAGEMALKEQKMRSDILLDERELEYEAQLEAANVTIQSRKGQGDVERTRNNS